jgi:hypothetical protein
MATAAPNSNHHMAMATGSDAACTLTLALAFQNLPRHLDEKSVCYTHHRTSAAAIGD